MPPRKPATKSSAKTARERELRQQGRQALADPDHVARHARRAMSSGATRSIARFSLRNQMLLSVQAEARGILLTDLDTYKGWWRRGRKPLRTKDALLVTVPKSYPHKPSEPASKPAPEPDSKPDASEVEPDVPKAFYMGRRWDISQTTELGADDYAEHAGQGDCGGCEARAGQPCEPGCDCFACASTDDQTPAEALWNTLQHDITRAGYQFVWPGDPQALNGNPVCVDHDAKTVHVSLSAAGDEDGLTALAVAAAEILTRQHSTRSPRAITAAA